MPMRYFAMHNKKCIKMQIQIGFFGFATLFLHEGNIYNKNIKF